MVKATVAGNVNESKQSVRDRQHRMSTKVKKDTNPVSDRLQLLVDKSSMKAAEIAREVDVSRATLSLYLNGRTPRADELNRLAQFFKVSIDWLMNGDTAVNDRDDAAVNEDPAFLYGPAKDKRLRWLPVLPWSDTQGGIEFLKERLADQLHGSIPIMTEDPDALVVIIGDEAMMPDHRPGGYAVLSPMLPLENGSLVMGRLRGNGVIFRKVVLCAGETLKLTSTNPQYGGPTDHNSDDFDWLYKVSFVMYSTE